MVVDVENLVLISPLIMQCSSKEVPIDQEIHPIPKWYKIYIYATLNQVIK